MSRSTKARKATFPETEEVPPGTGAGASAKGGFGSFERRILPHRQLDDAMAAIDAVRSRFRADPEEALEARALFIVGNAGCGKSTVLRGYEEKVRGTPGAFRTTQDVDIRPVVSLEVPMGAGKRQFVASILHALGYKAQESWDSSAIVDEIAYLCRAMQVECFLIDEAHHLVLGGGKRVTEIQEFLKSLLNRCCSQFVLAGIPSVLVLRNSEQMERRMVPTVYLDPYDWDDAEDQIEFRTLLEDFGRATGLRFDPPFTDDLAAARMYLATGGHVALVSKYLSRVIQTSDATSEIGMDILGRVWRSHQPRVEERREPRRFDATPVFAKTRNDPTNPFLADRKAFDKLWMARLEDEATRGIAERIAAANGWPA